MSLDTYPFQVPTVGHSLMRREFLNWDVGSHRHRLVVLAERHDRDALYGAIRQFHLFHIAHLVERERVVSTHVYNQQRPGWHRSSLSRLLPR